MLCKDVREGAWKAAAATEEHLSALRLLQVRLLNPEGVWLPMCLLQHLLVLHQFNAA